MCISPSGGTGRHRGLKIPRPMPCRFKSGLGQHPNPGRMEAAEGASSGRMERRLTGWTGIKLARWV